MKIWIFQTGEPLWIDKKKYRPMRAMLMAENLVANGHDVTVISTNFFHQEKKFRFNYFYDKKLCDKLRVVLINSPGYKNNIGLKRIYDHYILSKNLDLFLNKCTEKPDFAFIGYPPIEFANVALSWCNKYEITSTVDVKDLWPDIFEQPFRNIPKFIFKPFVYPYKIFARKTLKKANFITASSEKFLIWALKYCQRDRLKNDNIVQLIPDLRFINFDNNQILREKEKYEKKIFKGSYKKKFFFVGSITRSFDFLTLKRAIIENDEMKQCFFYIGGIGNKFEETKKMFSEFKNVYFEYSLNINQIQAVMELSDIAIAPYYKSEDFSQNTPNKIFDFILNSKPILTTLTGNTYDLIIKNELGRIYKEKDHLSLINEASKMINDNKLLSYYKQNCINYVKKYLNPESNYNNIIKIIESYKK